MHQSNATMRTCAILVLLVVRSASAADGAAKLEERVEKFVATKQKALDAAHQRMLKNIKGVENQIRKSDLDPDAKKLAVDRIRSEYERCDSTKVLPGCDELVGVAIQCVEDVDKIQKEIEVLRKSLVDKSIKTDDIAMAGKLDELEMQVAGLLGDRVELQAGEEWKGQSIGMKGGALTLKLRITEVSGSVFRGGLQKTTSGGTTEIMKVEGTRDGHHIQFKTTQMIRGPNQYWEIRGYVLGSRIVAEYGGKSSKGKLGGGVISLTK